MDVAAAQRCSGMPCAILTSSAEAGMSNTGPESITANTTIDEVVTRHPGTARVFIRRQMHCVGCQVDRFHTLAEACRIYGQPLGPFLAQLRRIARERTPVASNRANQRLQR